MTTSREGVEKYELENEDVADDEKKLRRNMDERQRWIWNHDPEADMIQATEMIRLTRGLLRRGCRYFTLSFHSSSLQPGFTPYSKTVADTDRILAELDKYLDYFTRELQGKMSTPSLVFDAETEHLKRQAR